MTQRQAERDLKIGKRFKKKRSRFIKKKRIRSSSKLEREKTSKFCKKSKWLVFSISSTISYFSLVYLFIYLFMCAWIKRNIKCQMVWKKEGSNAIVKGHKFYINIGVRNFLCLIWINSPTRFARRGINMCKWIAFDKETPEWCYLYLIQLNI